MIRTLYISIMALIFVSSARAETFVCAAKCLGNEDKICINKFTREFGSKFRWVETGGELDSIEHTPLIKIFYYTLYDTIYFEQIWIIDKFSGEGVEYRIDREEAYRREMKCSIIE